MNTLKKSERPKIKQELTNLDILFEVLAFITFAYLWYLVLTNYSGLPEQIAMHFDSAGKVDDYGSKTFIFVLPAIATALYSVLSIMNKFPHTFNYLVEITQSNAETQYTYATKMIRFLKLDVLILFAYITDVIIKDAQSTQSSLGIWFVPAFLCLTFIPIFIFIILMLRNK
jgi:uncharacterized membrane protein